MADEDNEAPKTELRAIFEESLKKPAKFALFSDLATEDKDDHAQAIKQILPTNKGPSLTSLFLQVQEEIKQRWPQPVGAKFVKSTPEQHEARKAQVEATREQLKEQSKKKLKLAVKKGMTKKPKAVTKTKT